MQTPSTSLTRQEKQRDGKPSNTRQPSPIATDSELSDQLSKLTKTGPSADEISQVRRRAAKMLRAAMPWLTLLWFAWFLFVVVVLA